MTEQTLDALRPLAEQLTDQAQRLQRALKGSSADEATVMEHAARAFGASQQIAIILKPEPVRYSPVTETRVSEPVRRRGRGADVSV